MTKIGKRVASLFLSVAVVLTMLPAAFAADDLDGHWSQDAMETWMDYCVIKGYEDGSVRPDKSITRGELAVMLDRIMSYQNKSTNNFNDLSDSWYTDAILGASAAGIIGGYEDGTVRPEATISRQEAVVMIARVLGLHVAGTADNMFTDANEIGSWAKDAVDAMAAAGYIHRSNGQFRPTAGITRAEIVTILNNIFAGLCREGGSYTEDVDGSLVVNSSDVSLEGMTIKGDLIIAEGVAANSVVLDGVTVEGRIIVRGGGTGSNAVVITGDSVVDTVVVQRQSEAVEIEVQGNAQVNEIVASSGTESVTVSGTVDTVTVDDANTTVEIAGTVNTLSVTENAANADVTVAKGATVDTVTTVAENTTLNVSGTIKDVTVSENANNATVSTEKGAKVESVTTAGSGTTVEGSGSVSKVEAAEGSTGTTVETSGTTIENNSSDTVTTDKGTVEAGETGTTSGSAVSGGSSGGSSSGSSGGSSGGHEHNYVDGVCSSCSEISSNATQVATAEELTKALDDKKTLIVLTDSFEVDSKITITYPLTLNGNGKTITASNSWTGSDNSNKHLLGVEDSDESTADNVTIKNIVFNSNSKALGIQSYCVGNTKLENVTTTGSLGAGLTVNGSTVTATGLHTSGNGWGGVNVDQGNGVTETTTFTFDAASTFGEPSETTPRAAVYSDKGGVTVNAPEGWASTTVEGVTVWAKLFNGGFGTEARPYEIANGSQFDNIGLLADSMKDGRSYNFKQTADITAGGAISQFSGTYDGGNYKISITKKVVGGNYSYLFDDMCGHATLKNMVVVMTDFPVTLFNCVDWGTAYGADFENITFNTQTPGVVLNCNVTNFGFCVINALYTKGEGEPVYNFTKVVNNVSLQNESTCTGVFVGSGPCFNVKTTVNYTDCVNNGNLVGTSSVGFLYGNSAYIECMEETGSQINVSGCSNTGTLTATNTNGIASMAPKYDGVVGQTQDQVGGTYIVGDALSADVTIKQSGAKFAVSSPAEGVSYKMVLSVGATYTSLDGQAWEDSDTQAVTNGQWDTVANVSNGKKFLVDITANEPVSGSLQTFKAYDKRTAVKENVLTEEAVAALAFNSDGYAIVVEEGTNVMIFNSDETVYINSSVSVYLYAYNNSGALIGTKLIQN